VRRTLPESATSRYAADTFLHHPPGPGSHRPSCRRRWSAMVMGCDGSPPLLARQPGGAAVGGSAWVGLEREQRAAADDGRAARASGGAGGGGSARRHPGRPGSPGRHRRPSRSAQPAPFRLAGRAGRGGGRHRGHGQAAVRARRNTAAGPAALCPAVASATFLLAPDLTGCRRPRVGVPHRVRMQDVAFPVDKGVPWLHASRHRPPPRPRRSASSPPSRWWRRSTAAGRGGSPWATRSPTARSPTAPGTSRSRSATWNGCWSSARSAGPRAGTTRSPGTPTTPRTWPTTPAGRPGARSLRRPASTPPSCSSPTTPGCTSSPPGTPARWWTRPPSR
jgi:hypothetical protein